MAVPRLGSLFVWIKIHRFVGGFFVFDLKMFREAAYC